MLIEISNMRDFTHLDDTAGSKLFLMEEIIEIFMPLFDEEIKKKERRLQETRKDYDILKNTVLQTKSELTSINQEHRKELLKKALLDELDVMFDKDIVYGSIKNAIIEMIETIDRVDVSRLEENIDLSKRLIYKNVRRVI